MNTSRRHVSFFLILHNLTRDEEFEMNDFFLSYFSLILFFSIKTLKLQQQYSKKENFSVLVTSRAKCENYSLFQSRHKLERHLQYSKKENFSVLLVTSREKCENYSLLLKKKKENEFQSRHLNFNDTCNTRRKQISVFSWHLVESVKTIIIFTYDKHHGSEESTELLI